MYNPSIDVPSGLLEALKENHDRVNVRVGCHLHTTFYDRENQYMAARAQFIPLIFLHRESHDRVCSNHPATFHNRCGRIRDYHKTQNVCDCTEDNRFRRSKKCYRAFYNPSPIREYISEYSTFITTAREYSWKHPIFLISGKLKE
ncbi:hypothetical protein ACOMHN_059047 [Nucella lapillus]